MRLGRIVRGVRRVAGLYRRSMLYQRFAADLWALMLADAVARLARARSGRAVLRLAWVGRVPPSLLALSEAVADSGVQWRFFAGDPRDVMHPSEPVESMAPDGWDVVIVADGDPSEEARLHDAMIARFADRPAVVVVRYGQLLRCHIDALNRVRRGDLRSTLNLRKLSLVGVAVALAPSEGIVVECGAYRGGTGVYVARLQQALGRDQRVFALDTFAGMPAAELADREAGDFYYDAGMFTDTSVDEVRRHYARQGVGGRVTAVPGLIGDTLPGILARHGDVSFALVDTDQYAGTASSLAALLPRLLPGGLIIVDDTLVSGVDRAIGEALEQATAFRRGSLSTNFDLLFANGG